MAFKLTADQMLELQALLQASNDSTLNQQHPIGQAYALLNQWASGQDGVDQASLAWLNGASQTNQGIGAYSTFIRNYTSSQYQLRYGTTLDNSSIQALSDSIGRNLINQILSIHNDPSQSDISDIPTIAQIGTDDAAVVIQNAFGGNIDAWSGVVLFPFLGNDTYLNTMLQSTDASSSYEALAAVSSIISATESTTLSSALTTIYNEVSADYPSGFGFSSTIATQIAGDLSGFISSAYGIDNFTALDTNVVLGTMNTDNTSINNTITLSDTSEIVNAGAGNDTIVTNGTASDNFFVVDGGAGNNIFDDSIQTQDMTVTSDANSYTLSRILVEDSFSADALTYALVNIETIKLGNGDNTVQLSLNAASCLQELDTGNGNDTISVTGGQAVNIVLGSGNDSITVGSDDMITAQPSLPTTNLPTDTIAFESQSIAGAVDPSGFDQYGRSYSLSGSTLTVTGSAGTTDTLTLNGFENGDYGVDLSYDIMPVAVSGAVSTRVGGISNGGVVTGDYALLNYGSSGSFTDSSGTIDTITLPGEGQPGYLHPAGFTAYGINAGGTIIGNGGVFAPDLIFPNAFVYSGGSFTELHDPDAYNVNDHSIADFANTQAYGINDNGTIVGGCYASSAMC